jgi:hypothetical protein
LHLLRRVVLLPAEHIALRAVCEAQLVHMDMGPEGDQAYEGILGEEIQCLLQRVSQVC